MEKTDDGTKVKKTSPMYIYYGSIEECEKDQRSGQDEQCAAEGAEHVGAHGVSTL